ncbi:MAG: tetratricopeptide repeat protein [Bernardetiaceae bacterium]|jgi:tetratricopeptide (TPR) repeat protein|nr:tetratricopeptide repeat protein [Bernardetiaceae bacterium]
MKSTLFLFLLWLGLAGPLLAQEDYDLANEYYTSGELDKAVALYAKIAKNKDAAFDIHKNYFDALQKLQQYDEAEKYLKRQIKAFPLEGMFNVDYGVLLNLIGRRDEATKHLDAFANLIKKDDNQIRYSARYFINANLFNYAEQLYLAGRKNGNDKFIYELASLYSIWGKIDKMLEEYLELLGEGENSLEYIQNILQSRVRDEEEFAKMEPILVRYIQKYPDQIAYNEMLLWYYVQMKDFNKALVQGKAIDRRKKLQGYNLYDLGMLAIENKEYTAAAKIFEYLVDRYKDQDIYASARKMLIKAKEEQVKNTFPVDYGKIRSLATDYAQLIAELGLQETTAEAAKSLALLQAFYLNNKDTAIKILETVTRTPGLKKDLVAQAKIDLGDIYLLKGEPWESALLYAQVEKSEKNTNTAQLAKLKNAKLSYYKGDFEYAKEFLDVLKLATSREIANDAMHLSLLIGDNLALDTTEATLKEFAAVDLLVFQSKLDEALAKYDGLLKKYPRHSLTDEIYWAKANIFYKQGQFAKAVDELRLIGAEYAEDILADDAHYLLARIYEENLRDREMAQKLYLEQLTKFPGSIFTVEARKRLRNLRGDNLN